MDLLKQEILIKRKSRDEESGGKKFVKRSEMEQKKIHKFREEERRDQERRASAASGKALASTSCKSSASEAASIAESKSLTDEKMIQTLPIPRQEVIRRLRFLKQPMTLFGEDDQVRLDRLEYVLKEGLFEVDMSDMTQGLPQRRSF